MAHQRKPAARDRVSVKKSPPDSPVLPNIAHLITYGYITIGRQVSIGCLATACDEDQCLAMLVRRKDESLMQLLTRLDAAIAKAYEENTCVDEVNPPDPYLKS